MLCAALTGAGFIAFALLAAQTALFGRIEPVPLILIGLIAPPGRVAELAGWQADDRDLAFFGRSRWRSAGGFRRRGHRRQFLYRGRLAVRVTD